MKSLRSLGTLLFTTQNIIPTIGFTKIWLEQNYAQLRSILPSLSKMAITFSTQLRIKQFKRNLNYNSIIYSPTTILAWARKYQFNCKETPISGLFTALLFLFSSFSSHNPLLKTLLKINNNTSFFSSTYLTILS